ncbi:Hypothetical protein PBC10988_32710 [Planctomycetales bacterium 10988]|nr:Hypothetical protein PBC10988_32710 [Planctomycetales bacterium 10988]
MNEPMTLQPLYDQLALLRKQIWKQVWLTRLLPLASAALVLFFCLFLVDWTIEPGRVSRLIWIGVFLAIGLVIGIRQWVTWQRYPSKNEELILQLEKANGMLEESDLVAALQFQRSASPAWGSPFLQAAVVEYVQDVAEHEPLQGPVIQRSPRSSRFALGGILLGWLLLLIWIPQLLGIFAQRLFLQEVTYPRQVQLERLTIAGTEVYSAARSDQPFQPIVLSENSAWEMLVELKASSQVPQAGNLILIDESGVEETFPLKPISASSGIQWRFEGIPLDRSTDYVLQLGDLASPRGTLEVLPLPRVDLLFTIEPPDYTQPEGSKPLLLSGRRQVEVLEGSKVALALKASKPLAAAWLVLDESEIPLLPDPHLSTVWRLPEEVPAFAEVRKEFRFEIRVEDPRGWLLPEPVFGTIRLRQDYSPRVSATRVTREILPQAKPSIEFEVTDDFGLAMLEWKQRIQFADPSRETLERRIPFGSDLVTDGPLRIEAAYTLSLESLSLSKGDEIEMMLLAKDERGRFDGKWGKSEKLRFLVTDERGLHATITEVDQETARQLDELIDRQLGKGN